MNLRKNKVKKENALQLTSGFARAGVYARRQFCGDLEVCRPPEPLWNPRLREVAATLAASGEMRRTTEYHTEKRVQSDCAMKKQQRIEN